MDWDTVDLVVFDLDGTLYDQRPLRRRMAVEIAWEVLKSRSLRIPRIISTYRKLREASVDDPKSAVEPYEVTATRCGVSEAEVRKVIMEWMERRPLRYLRRCRRPRADRLFEGLRSSRRLVAVLSDYPTDAKLNALGMAADFTVSALDPDVARLKPDPTGLAKLLRMTSTLPARALVIGDRDDRDGEVARRLGVRSLILSRRKCKRDGTFRCFTDPRFTPVMPGASPNSNGKPQILARADVAKL